MFATRPIPGRWSRWVSGTAAHGRRSDRANALTPRREPRSCRRAPRHARSGGRLAVAAALAAALLLSPGARDACAGCCRDEAPAVAASLAAGVAPVHCCHAEPGPAPTPGCCGATLEPAFVAEATASPTGAAAERAECLCHLHSRDGLPAEPSRLGLSKRSLDDSAPLFAVADVLPLPAAAGEPARAIEAGAVPRRPVRILYGVWRN